MTLLGIGFDAGTLPPWIVAAVLWALGYAAWRWAGGKVRAELDAIQAEAGGLA